MPPRRPAAPAGDARALLAAVREHPAWAVVRLREEPDVVLLGGTPETVARILDVPLEQGAPEPGRRFDRLLAVPFHQVTERGFEAHDDGTPLRVVTVTSEDAVPLAELIEALPDVDLGFTDRGGFETDDQAYAGVVESIIRDEIGNGAGANLVVGRHYRARLSDWDGDAALTVLRRLLERERGAYWTYCFFTGDRYLVGASPERHVSVHDRDVRMNPISGTFRVTGEGDIKQRLLDFLADEKEIFELFMVVDEELKMMCEVCSEGGTVLGPFLKPMTHLVHTEYLLAGRTGRDVREVLRDTMYAATVTGSPVENACRLIRRYEAGGRGYYAGALALLGRDEEGGATLDSPIVIRTADVDLEGNLTVTAGATLVRDSDPAYEVAETRAKAGGILSAFGLVPPAGVPAAGVAELARDEDVLLALAARNQRLSSFWLTDQEGNPPDPSLAGASVLVIDGEDDFVNMLRHLFRMLGMRCEVVRHERIGERLDTATGFAAYDLVVVGPGPGDPRDDADPKMVAMRAAVDRLLADRQPFLAVCLGHQALCHRLGLELGYKDIVFQGTQSTIELAGRSERVGFYNTFVARVGDRALPAGVEVAADAATGDVHAITGPHYRGIQFHAESILSQRGYDLVHDLVVDLLR